MSNQENDQMYRMNSYKFDQNCTFLDAYEYRILRLMSTFHPNCYPSIAYLSNKCVLSESTIKRSIKRMIAKRIMKKNVGWKTIKDNETRVNEYFIDFDKIEELSNADRNNEDKIEEMMAFEVNDSLIKVPQTLSCGSHRPTIVPSIIVPINIYKADALEEGLETNPVSAAQIDNAEISSESLNDTDGKIQVAFNAERDLPIFIDLVSTNNIETYASNDRKCSVEHSEDRNYETLAEKLESPAAAAETPSTLPLDKPPLPKIDEMKIMRMWNAIADKYHRIQKARLKHNSIRYQRICAFSKQLEITDDLWGEIFQEISRDAFWNGTGKKSVNCLTIDMILNADRLNNFLEKIEHKREIIAQKLQNDLEFAKIDSQLYQTGE